MRIALIGELDDDAIAELRGAPLVVLRCTVEEARAAAPLLFADVTLTAASEDGPMDRTK